MYFEQALLRLCWKVEHCAYQYSKPFCKKKYFKLDCIDLSRREDLSWAKIANSDAMISDKNSSSSAILKREDTVET